MTTAPVQTKVVPAEARPAKRRRWHRAAIPLALVAGLLVTTAVAYAVEQPDTTDPAFLSPDSDEDIGARRLADRVRAEGVSIEQHSRTGGALLSAQRGDATLLIPAPGLVHRQYLRVLRLLPASVRVVLVEPRATSLRNGRLPVTAAARRWAAAVQAPGDSCELPEAAQAGRAAATRQRYAAVHSSAVELARCYDNALLAVRLAGLASGSGGPELVLAGAVDPFRNDRIGEHNNAELTTGLLTTRPRLVWLDLHATDAPPFDPSATGEPGVDPTMAPGGDDDSSGDGDDPGAGTGSGDGSGNGTGSGRGEDDDPQAGGGRSALLDAFPPWFWALLAQLALAALLVALWRARRLGPPVAEPLPVTVRAAETVRGRGRLYQRARARGPALVTLRSAARDRLATVLSLPPDADREAVVGAVAAQIDRPAEEVEELLYGSAPDTDEDLVRMAGELDALVHAVTAPPPATPRREDEQ